jgi:hypothetical protein
MRRPSLRFSWACCGRLFVLLLIVAGGATGCAAPGYLRGTDPLPSAPVRPPYGVLFTHYSAPLDYDFDKTPVLPDTERKRRTGTSSSHFIWIETSDQRPLILAA